MRNSVAALLLASVALATPSALAGEAPSPDLAGQALSVSWQQSSPSTPEARAIAARTGLRIQSLCPNCAPSNVTDGHCYWSRISRVVILNAVMTGHTEDEIVAVYQRLYGPRVLARGTEHGLAVMSWILPYVVGGGSLAGLLVLGGRMRRRPQTQESEPVGPPADDGARAELHAALDALD